MSRKKGQVFRLKDKNENKNVKKYFMDRSKVNYYECLMTSA